jgi:hypothetical protein
MTSSHAKQIDRAEELFIGLPDADFDATIAHVFSSRAGIDTAVRDVMLSLLHVNRSAGAIKTSAQGMAEAIASTLRSPTVVDRTRRMLQIEGEAKAAVLQHDMLTATEVAEALAISGTNRREIASRLRRAGKIVGIRKGQRYVYPAFQFDRRTGVVRPPVVEGNRQLDSRNDPWGVASFWLSPSGRLDNGRTPADLVVAGEDDVVRDLIADVLDKD